MNVFAICAHAIILIYPAGGVCVSVRFCVGIRIIFLVVTYINFAYSSSVYTRKAHTPMLRIASVSAPTKLLPPSPITPDHLPQPYSSASTAATSSCPCMHADAAAAAASPSGFERGPLSYLFYTVRWFKCGYMGWYLSESRRARPARTIGDQPGWLQQAGWSTSPVVVVVYTVRRP